MTTAFTLCHDAQAKRFVRSFWQTQGSPTYQSETILPKGIVEIIFSFDDAVSFSRNSQTGHTPTLRCFINGMNDMPVQLIIPEKQTFFGMVLYPVAVKKLLKIPSGEFLNNIADLETINKEFNSLWHQMAEVDSFHARVAIAQQWLKEISSETYEQEMAISSFLDGSLNTASVNDLAAQFCYSTRQLHRKAKELFGMSTEGLIRYKRYVHALQETHHSPESLTRIGYKCLYYDQAHFIREFKDFTGITPGEYRHQKQWLAGHLYNNVRYVQ